MLYHSIKLLVLLVIILLSVAFITLLERKTLGYIQKRKGPNKLGLKGVLQPFSDAIKLLLKETIVLNNAHQLIYFISPTVVFLIAILLWLSFPSAFGGLEISLPIIFILCCLATSVFPILRAG